MSLTNEPVFPKEGWVENHGTEGGKGEKALIPSMATEFRYKTGPQTRRVQNNDTPWLQRAL